jgi:hypothetical protein
MTVPLDAFRENIEEVFSTASVLGFKALLDAADKFTSENTLKEVARTTSSGTVGSFVTFDGKRYITVFRTSGGEYFHIPYDQTFEQDMKRRVSRYFESSSFHSFTRSPNSLAGAFQRASKRISRTRHTYLLLLSGKHDTPLLTLSGLDDFEDIGWEPDVTSQPSPVQDDASAVISRAVPPTRGVAAEIVSTAMSNSMVLDFAPSLILGFSTALQAAAHVLFTSVPASSSSFDPSLIPQEVAELDWLRYTTGF